MWTHYLPLVEAAVRRSEGVTSTDEVLGEVVAHRAQVWPGESSVAVTQIQTKESTKVLHIWLAAGKLGELLKMLEAGIDYALNQGLDAVDVDGRKGWKRVLTPLGFKEHDGLLRKELYHGK